MTANTFHIDVKLSNKGTDEYLTPLAIPSYKEINSGNNSDQGTFKFAINLSTRTKLDQLTISITQGGNELVSMNLPSQYLVNGNHIWKWDGYSDAGILDTSTLQKSLLISLTGHQTKTLSSDEKQTRSKSASLTTKCKSAEADWIDCIVNKRTNKITLKLRTNITDGGSNGVNELPPSEVQNLQVYKDLPSNSPAKQAHVRVRNFTSLRSMVLTALNKYWSRAVTIPGGKIYNVEVDAISTKQDAMDDVELLYNTNSHWVRSSNPGKVRGIISLFGNFVPERISYNIGWINYGNGSWEYQTQLNEDLQFSHTAAHEIGHEILSAYGGATYSYSHRGSSTLITQKTKSVAEGGLNYPTSGSIDLMKYYNGSSYYSHFSRTFASEQDVKSLLWLSRVKMYAQ